jgi:tRNA1Val (adenine37-N6)-methyltransferase
MSVPITRDSISLRGAGIVTIRQEKEGARFTLDSLLLADFCRIKPHDTVLEPGAGTGIVSLLLAKKYPETAVVAVENQAEAAALCRQNILDNGLDDRILFFENDIRTLAKVLKPSTFDVIVANPPYTRSGTGKESPHAGRLSARHDLHGDLKAWLDLQVFLKNKGRYVFVFPSDRLAELISLLRSRKLEPKCMRLVHPRPDKPASLVLLEAVKASGIGLEVLSPLIVHRDDGGYTDEMRRIYDPF